MDALKSLFSDFDFAAFLPKLDTVLGWIQLVCRLCVMAGPLILLGLGLLYLLNPPKEANHSVGYRFWWSMASLDAWQFTHKLVGIIWSVLGLGLTITMALLCNRWNLMAPMDMVWNAIVCLLWELGLSAASCLIINVIVIIVFDRNGFRRRDYH